MLKGRKFVTLLIAFVAAGLLWLYVVSTVAPEATSRVGYIPVSIDGTIVLEERGLMVTGQATKTITLELKTSRVNLSKLNASSIRISADASKIREPGTYDLSYSIQFPDTVNSNDVDIIRKSSNRVTVTVTRKETKSVPVTVNWSGTVMDGYSAETGSSVIRPEEILLEGPEEDVSRVTEARINFDYSNLNQTVFEQVVPVTFLDSSGKEVILSELTTASANEASLTLQILRTKEVELKVQLLPGGGVQEEDATVTINPPSIFVKGSTETVEAMESTLLIGSPIDLAEVLDEKDYSFNLVLPAGVINETGETSVDVNVKLHGISTAELQVRDIRVVNLREAFSYMPITQVVNITIRGNEDEIAALLNTPDNGLYIELDLSSVTETGRVDTKNNAIPYRIVIEDHPNIYAQLDDQITGTISLASSTGQNG